MKIHPYIYAGMAEAITREKVIEAVCSFYGLEEKELFQRSRKKKIRQPRQIAHFLLSREAGMSSPKIGKFFGGMDHSTVLNSIEKVENQLSYDEEFQNEMEGIMKKLNLTYKKFSK